MKLRNQSEGSILKECWKENKKKKVKINNLESDREKFLNYIGWSTTFFEDELENGNDLQSEALERLIDSKQKEITGKI